jgi:hypothetical protein
MASTTRIYTQDDRSLRVLQLDFRAQEAQLCGADWTRSQTLQDTQA